MKNILYTAGDEKSHKDLGKYLQGLPAGDYIIQVKKNRPIRSLSANRYYHLILNIMGIETGHTHEQLHEICKLKFNPEIINTPKGGSIVVGRTTGDMDTKEFGAYVNRVKQWARDEFNMVIPEPGEMDRLKQYEIENRYEAVHSGY